MTMSRLFLLTAVSLLAVTACTSLDKPLAGAADGMVTENNFKAQVVDPKPASGAPIMDAEMANAAIKRYRDGKVKTGEKEDAPAITVNLPPAS